MCPERLDDAADFSVELSDTKRNIVFVAHGIGNDDEYMKTLGYGLSQAANLARQVDSQRVAGGTKKNGIGLKRLLEQLGVRYQGLHNGGNGKFKVNLRTTTSSVTDGFADAAYTLQALVVMAVKQFKSPGVIFDPSSPPALVLPGTRRSADIPAPHVYGGTAVRGAVELPIDGGKNGKKKYIKKATGAKKGPNTTNNKQPNQSFSTASPGIAGRGEKRPAPVDDDAVQNGAKRRKPARQQ